MRPLLVMALLLAAAVPAGAGDVYRIRNDGVAYGSPFVLGPSFPYFSELHNHHRGDTPLTPASASVRTSASSLAPPAPGSVSASAGLVQGWPGSGGGDWTPGSRSTGGFGPLIHGLPSPSSFLPPLGPDDTLQLSGIGTWLSLVYSDGGTLVLDGLKGVPWEIKRKLRSGRLGGAVLDLGPKLTAVGFERLVVEEIVSYEELAQDTGLDEVGRSLDWAAPRVYGPEIYFMAGVSATESDSDVEDALASFSGASVFQGLADTAFTSDTFLANKLQDHLDQLVDRRVARALRGEEPDPPWSAFTQAVGSRSDRGDDLWVDYGAIAGVERRLGERGLLGAFAGYRRTSASRVDPSGSSFRSDDPSAGLYGSWGCGCGFRLDAASWYTWRDYDGARRIRVANGFASHAAFETEAHQLTSFARAAFDWRPFTDSALVVAPRFAVQYSRLAVDGYEESGAGALDLDVGSQVPESLRTALGFRIAAPFELGSARLRPELRGDWYHELFDGTQVPVAVESPYFNDFHVETRIPERDFGKIGLGVTASFGHCSCLELGLGFDTLVSGQGLDALDTTIHAGVRF